MRWAPRLAMRCGGGLKVSWADHWVVRVGLFGMSDPDFVRLHEELKRSGCLSKNQIILIEGSHTLTSDHDTTTLGSRHGRRAAMSNSLPITASNASI